MAPKIFNLTPRRRRKIRNATLTALLALVPSPAQAVVDFWVGLSDSQFDDVRSDATLPHPVRVVEPVRPPAPSLGYDITRDDARIVCRNLKRGTTAEFLVSISTSGALAGKRIVSVLDGDKWTGFAFADGFGVHVWGRMKGESKPYEAYAAFLENLSAHAGKVEISIDPLD